MYGSQSKHMGWVGGAAEIDVGMLLPGQSDVGTSGKGESLSDGVPAIGLEPLDGAVEEALQSTGGGLVDSRIGEALKRQMNLQKQQHQQLVRGSRVALAVKEHSVLADELAGWRLMGSRFLRQR